MITKTITVPVAINHFSIGLSSKPGSDVVTKLPSVVTSLPSAAGPRFGSDVNSNDCSVVANFIVDLTVDVKAAVDVSIKYLKVVLALSVTVEVKFTSETAPSLCMTSEVSVCLVASGSEVELSSSDWIIRGTVDDSLMFLIVSGVAISTPR